MSEVEDDSWRAGVEEESGIRQKPPLKVVTARDTRPDIPCGPLVHETSDRMGEALKADPDLYKRGGQLAHVLRVQPDDKIPGASVGSPVIRHTPLSWLSNRVSRFARCVKKLRTKTGECWVTVQPPLAQVRAVLEQGTWCGIRELRGVIEAPAMRPDGTIIQTPGYDRATGYLYEPNASFIPVADEPTHSDAVLAYARLAEVFCDFPFVSPAHLAATISVILTLFARPAILGSVPAVVFDASAKRIGKSLQTDAIHLILFGRCATRMTYPETDEELEKILAGYAMRGSATVNFDNVARSFGGAALDKVITAIDEVDLRVLGSNDMRTYSWMAVVFASGNNVTFRGDMAPRVLCPRIESKLENPETRDDFVHPDLRAWVLENRAVLVHAALTILRAYVVAGCPDMGCPRWGGFEAWSRLIPHALKWVGAEDPMGARRGLSGDSDPEAMAHAGLVDGWERLCRAHSKPDGLTVKQALTILYPGRREEGPPDGLEDLREVVENVTNAKPGFAPAGKALGDKIRRFNGRVVNGKKLVGSQSAGVMRWRVAVA